MHPAITNLNMGTYRWKRATLYTLLARRKELEPLKHSLSKEQYFKALEQRPQDLILRYRFLNDAPPGWEENQEHFGR